MSLGSLRTAGAPDDLALETAVFAASAADIGTVVIDGRDVMRDGSTCWSPTSPPSSPARSAPS